MSHLLWGSLSATVITALLGSSLPAIAIDAQDPNANLETDVESVDVTAVEPRIPSEVVEESATVAIALNQTAIYPHQSGSSTAATLFVNQIPVATFLGEANTANTVITDGFLTPAQIQNGEIPFVTATESDPIWRAAQVAQQISQLDPTVAADIALNWDKTQKAYAVQIGEQTLLTVNSKNTLPRTTRNLDQDALGVVNLIRRQVGNAPALTTPNTPRPRPRPSVATSSRSRYNGQRGQASWYGPGFHGRRTANGERYNQNAMTAAHRSLPFGTRVRVTNLNNGRSVVVRINDRGPFIRGRVIDLSRAGAGAIGMISSGVAPVRLEVLN